jgi:RNA polymerase sigma-70 factor (subfamily 1)
MTTPSRWNLEDYRPLLRLVAENIRLAPRLRVRFDESDLVQITLLRAHAHIGDCEALTEEEFIGWLNKIMANTLIDKVREAHARKCDVRLERSIHAAVDDSFAGIEILAEQSSPSGQAELHEIKLHLVTALEALPEDQKAAVNQRYLLGATIAEIAETLECTEKSVSGLLYRGLKQLRSSMKKFQ